MGRGPVDELRDLDRRDAELRARADRLSDLDAVVAALRDRAEAIDRFVATYAVEDSRLRDLATAARLELTQREGERDQAQLEHDRARDDEARLLAARRRQRAVDHVAVAEASIARAQAAHALHEGEAEGLPGELTELEQQARAVADELPDVPDPGSGPSALVDWASRSHAAIFVALGSTDLQRERVIREANELASMLLGEPTYGSTVAQVTARVVASER